MYDIDEMCPPLEIRVDGTVYPIIKVSKKVLKQLDVIISKNDKDKIQASYKQFAYLTDSNLSEVKGIELRKIRKAIMVIMEDMAGIREAKNAKAETSTKE